MRNIDSAIGGYFELEISGRGSIYHDSALALNTGRNAFEYILISKKYKRVHIPYFTCDVLLQPLKKLNIEYIYYHIDEAFNPNIANYHYEDAILYTNYYGLNQINIDLLVKKYNHVIIDNAQAFFDPPIDGVSTFYSPRKFIGIPDGGFVYESIGISTYNYEFDSSTERIMHLLTRIENGAESGYTQFKINDSKLDNQPIKRMSKLTRKLLSGVNFNEIREKRMNNFDFVHQNLKRSNKLTAFIEQSKMKSPLVYPYWVDNGSELRNLLTTHKIFTAMYWPNVLERVQPNTIEYEFTNNVVCIPIDQRYHSADLVNIMERII
jgi:hypothetical protein